MNLGRERPSPQRYVGALIGGALGDALGWPYEQRATPAAARGKLNLDGWVKRSGGRFQPHTETLAPGSYSDDTQLVLAVARSRIRGGRWWEYLAHTELPFWPVYERGGGGATLRATKLLARGTLPWEARPVDRDKYFGAGGNGAAMRLAPHVLFGADAQSYHPIAEAIMSDGVLTHGHPRALLGALAYGYALWTAIRTRNTLAYGELVHAVRDNVGDWAAPADLSNTWPTWWQSAERNPRFHIEWDRAVDEIMAGLHIAARGLEEGALGNDTEVLTDLGAFSKSINGAGTVAAVSSIFLASKHAAAPFEGVARAALAKGADTDTIASLTGTLAGAVSGTDWLGSRPVTLQDVSYIERIALALSRGETHSEEERARPFTAKDAQSLFDALERGLDHLRLPIGLSAEVRVSDHIATSAPSLRAESWKIETREGQTFFVKKLRKTPEQPVSANQHRSAKIVATRLWVADLAASRLVYEMALGLDLTSQSDTHLQFGEAFALRLGETSAAKNPSVTLYVSVSNLEAVHEQFKALDLIHVGMITRKSGRAAFGCIDRDGHRLEIFEG